MEDKFILMKFIKVSSFTIIEEEKEHDTLLSILIKELLIK
jgi:hypothetical protein